MSVSYPTISQIESILTQMKEEGKRYEDYESEYFEGEHRTYYFDKEKQVFIFVKMDVVAASYYDEIVISEKELINALSDYSLYDFKESGFNI